jgi:hypothetical protein
VDEADRLLLFENALVWINMIRQPTRKLWQQSRPGHLITGAIKMKNRNALSVLPVLFLVTLACGSLKSLVPAKGQFFTGDAAQKAAQAVRDKIGKPFKVIEVFIDDNEFRVQAQDPNNLKNVDEYKYLAGFVSGPSPVKLSAINDDVEKSSYPFDEIDFSAIPKFTKEALDRSGIEGAKIYRLTFQRAFALTDSSAGALGKAYWNIEINGTRENVTASADPKGKLMGVDVSRTAKAADYTIFNKDELQKAQDAIKSQVADRPNIIEIVMYDKSLMFKVPNSENPKVTDGYKFDINGLSRSDLVKLPNINMPGSENFSINDIDLPKAADLIDKTRKRIGLPDAKVQSFSIRRSKSPFDKKGFRTIWDVSMKSGIKEGSVEYDNDGTEIRVRKNGEIISEEK